MNKTLKEKEKKALKPWVVYFAEAEDEMFVKCIAVVDKKRYSYGLVSKKEWALEEKNRLPKENDISLDAIWGKHKKDLIKGCQNCLKIIKNCGAECLGADEEIKSEFKRKISLRKGKDFPVVNL